MKKLIIDLWDEIKLIFKGNTLDAVIPPIVFLVVHTFYGLEWAMGVALVIGLITMLTRLLKKTSIVYAFTGILGVLIAFVFVYFSGQTDSYFLPGIISSVFITGLALVTIIIKKPLAALTSHLTRGWSIQWYWRKDVLPAYQEVTLFWFILFVLRLIIQVSLFQSDAIDSLIWVNALLGFPAIAVVLIITYIYGIWRLRTLKGPGVDEFEANKKPPWRGQIKGF